MYQALSEAFTKAAANDQVARDALVGWSPTSLKTYGSTVKALEASVEPGTVRLTKALRLVMLGGYDEAKALLAA